MNPFQIFMGRIGPFSDMVASSSFRETFFRGRWRLSISGSIFRVVSSVYLFMGGDPPVIVGGWRGKAFFSLRHR